MDYIIKLVATDLDGTLLRDDKSISEADMASLKFLEENNIVIVAATGRSIHKVNEVLPENAPFDYIVFSSGGGIFDWKDKKLLASEQFNIEKTHEICLFLLKRNLNFFVFQPIPENNLFHYHQGAVMCNEFQNYLIRHKGDFTVLDEYSLPANSGQFMAIIPNNELLFESIKSELNFEYSGIRVIRTTSPVDEGYIWLEIFPDSVSKGHGLKWLCRYLGIPFNQTAGIGNDFNDMDMLGFVAKPFLLENSPSVLKKEYPWVAATNNQNGFSEVLKILGF